MPYYYYIIRTPDNQMKGSVHIDPATPEQVFEAFKIPQEQRKFSYFAEVDQQEYKMWREWTDGGGRPPTTEELDGITPDHVAGPLRT
jgi:hypothetical protein